MFDAAQRILFIPQHIGLLAAQAAHLAALRLSGIQFQQRRQRKGEVLRNLSVLFHIVQQRGQDARAPLRNGVQANCQQTVIDIWVGKALQHGICKGAQFLFRLIDGRQNLFFQRFADESAEIGIEHRVAHDVEPRKVRRGHKGSVRAVEQTHLARAVGRKVLGIDHGQPRLLQRHLLFDLPVAGNDPAHVRLRCDKAIVLHTELCAQRICISGLSRHDAVHQRGSEGAALVQPIQKTLP